MHAGIVHGVRVRFTNVVLLLAVPAVAPAMAPFGAGLHWTIDLLACFPVQAMGWLALAAAILFAARRCWPGAVCTLFAAVAAAAVLPAWLAGAPLPAANGMPLRVLCLNLLFDNVQVARALETVRQSAPDVVLCVEVTPAWLAGLQTGLTDFPHRCSRADPGCYGVALFSRLPLHDTAVIPLGCAWAPALRAVIETAAGPVGLLGVHTPRPGNGARAADRDTALAAVANAIAPLPPMRIVLGDFNATPWNAAFAAMLGQTGLVALSASGFHATWPSVLPWPLRIPIDHVLASPGIGLATMAVGTSFGSDHLPLCADLCLPHP